ncbi:MAG: helix-turn-helix domain-containing protein [Sphingomonas sp.]|nr:helix-turn-helix domain-containing protein [Sphingomonas sp.]
MGNALMIGDLATATGTKVSTIRFYEEIGLMPRAARTASGRRIYCEGDLRRLRFIRNARKLGFDSAEIRSLLALSARPDSDCGAATQIALVHLQGIVKRMTQLKRLKRELTLIAESCEGGTASNCRVLEALGDSPLARD